MFALPPSALKNIENSTMGRIGAPAVPTFWEEFARNFKKRATRTIRQQAIPIPGQLVTSWVPTPVNSSIWRNWSHLSLRILLWAGLASNLAFISDRSHNWRNRSRNSFDMGRGPCGSAGRKLRSIAKPNETSSSKQDNNMISSRIQLWRQKQWGLLGLTWIG